MEKRSKRHADTGLNDATALVDDDVYKKVVEFEEKEASARDSKKDATLYIQTCAEIGKILSEILSLKTAGSEDKAVVAKKSTEACILTSVLKKLNRLEKVRLSGARDSIHIEKQKVESRYMQYQNLLYEVDHYNSEFRKCMQYKSRDAEINLISNEDFFENAPVDITSQFLFSDEKSHEMYLARLDFELKQRINLSQLLEFNKGEKKQIKEEIISMKGKLEAMEPKLLAVVEAAKPLQDHLGLNIGDIHAEHKLAVHLPDPLYLMYCNANAYRQFIEGKCMTIEIKGDLEEVKRFDEARRIVNEESDHEHELSEEITGAKKRRRKGVQVDREEEKGKHMLQKHPLCVEVTMKVEHITLKMLFNYLPQLRIVTVAPNLDGTLPTSASARLVLAGESILNHLYPRDTGTESPNLVNHYQLKRVGIERFETLIPVVGHAYAWAQKICGLEFLNLLNFENRLKLQDKAYLHTVEETFSLIWRRLKARTALAQQLHYLEQNILPSVPERITLPASTTAKLTKFAPVTFGRLCSDMQQARELARCDLLDPHDHFYLASIAKPKATLSAWIVIKNEYPDAMPIFLLHVKCNDERDSRNSDEIRDMERIVNTMDKWMSLANGASTAGWLLAAQMKYLCSLFDVYLETEQAAGSPTTVFFRKVSGRNRKRPFKYNKAANMRGAIQSCREKYEVDAAASNEFILAGIRNMY